MRRAFPIAVLLVFAVVFTAANKHTLKTKRPILPRKMSISPNRRRLGKHLPAPDGLKRILEMLDGWTFRTCRPGNGDDIEATRVFEQVVPF